MSTPLAPTDLPTTLGTLRASNYEPKSVREEIRAKSRAATRRRPTAHVERARLRGHRVAQLETALLAGHDIILLGERGQAKTRMIRSLVELLDEWLPIVDGSEIRDDPFAPISAYAIELVAQKGDDTPVTWVHRSQRFAEKLASPDTSMADLIVRSIPSRSPAASFWMTRRRSPTDSCPSPIAVSRHQ